MTAKARGRPPGRPNQERDAEIYQRTLVTEELSNGEAATKYSLSKQRISCILTEEHQRRHGPSIPQAGFDATHAAKRHRLRDKTQRRDTKRQRNAEIYHRTVVTGELVIEEAALEYGTGEANISQILTAEHHRTALSERRPAVPRQRNPAPRSRGPKHDRNRDIYRRVIITGEISASKAATEYEMTRQRVAQILNEMYQQAHDGQPRPRYYKYGNHQSTEQEEPCSTSAVPTTVSNSLRNAQHTQSQSQMTTNEANSFQMDNGQCADTEPGYRLDPSRNVPCRQAPTHHTQCGDDDQHRAFFSQQTSVTVPWEFWERCLDSLMTEIMIDELAHQWVHDHEIDETVTILERHKKQGNIVERECDISVCVRFELHETGYRTFEGLGRIFADEVANGRPHQTPNAPPLGTVQVRIEHQEQ